jgi:hypothetical protein
VRSVDVTLRRSTSDDSAVTGSNARSSSRDVTRTVVRRLTASRALRVVTPRGRFPGRYGRNVMAGSVSSGIESCRSD